MTSISFILPTDQPLGKRRLLEDLKAGLQDARFTDFRLAVAYAKTGPLYRLQKLLEQWRRAGKTSSAILGFDQQGTSKEALELALSLFDTVYVVQEAGITFHPKIYLFKGDHHAKAFIGSNNLTVGGTEKNFEAAIELKLDLPADSADLKLLETFWSELQPDSCSSSTQLDAAVLAQLANENLVVAETAMHYETGRGGTKKIGRARKSGLPIKPESPLPKANITPAAITKYPFTQPTKIRAVRRHVIQIKPHHNGEIFLSLSAVLQNPEFFGWPFTGMTTPKNPNNPSYPQLDPDPIVNITVFGEKLAPLLTRYRYPLNTVYYEKKSEIRITASPLVNVVPEYSVMIMEKYATPNIDYEIIIHTPDSPEYGAWVAACNQQMPGGGKQPRKFGWF